MISRCKDRDYLMEKKEAAKGNKTRQITTTINLTWQNNRLTQAVVVEKENDSEDGVENEERKHNDV